MPKTCAWPNCNNPVISTAHNARYCSLACRSKASHENKMAREGKARQHRECPICKADMTYAHRSAIWCPICKPGNHHDRVNREQEAIDIAQAREGLPPLKPGRIKCECGTWFRSWDINKKRMCDRCTQKADILNTGAVPTAKWGKP